MEVSQKAKIRTTTRPSYIIPGHRPKGLYILLQRYLQVHHVHCCSSHNLENGISLNTRCITNEQLMKMWYTVEYNDVYSVVKEYETMKFVEGRTELKTNLS